jgi:hypothetical protein
MMNLILKVLRTETLSIVLLIMTIEVTTEIIAKTQGKKRKRKEKILSVIVIINLSMQEIENHLLNIEVEVIPGTENILGIRIRILRIIKGGVLKGMINEKKKTFIEEKKITKMMIEKATIGVNTRVVQEKGILKKIRMEDINLLRVITMNTHV